MNALVFTAPLLVGLLTPDLAQNLTLTKLGSANTGYGAGSGAMNESGQVAVNLTTKQWTSGAYFRTRTGGLQSVGDFGVVPLSPSRSTTAERWSAMPHCQTGQLMHFSGPGAVACKT